LLALASRDWGRAEQWAREFAVPRVYASYEAVLADSELDAVYIPLPNELHKPWVMAAADAGKHVLCEKPLALDSQEAAAMVEHCRRRGVIVMEAFMWRHQPRTLEIRKRVRDGAIGELRLVRASFSFPIEPGDWRLDPARGGGALWDVGCYGVSTARLFAGGEPRMARALAHFRQSGVDVAKTHHAERDDYDGGRSGVDLTLTAVLEFESDVLATIDCSFEQPFRCHYELVGSRGSVEVPDAYLPPKASKPTALLRSLGAASDSSSGGDRVDVLQFEPVDQYAAMVDAFSRSVAAGGLVDPAEDGLDQMRVLDQLSREARAAHRSGPTG
jgi:predicted dehydrogenase